jgi:hypothetical protein
MKQRNVIILFFLACFQSLAEAFYAGMSVVAGIKYSVVQNPITGRTRGKFATAVFSKIFGKNVMRAKAIQVHNPKTTAQKTQRMRFSLIVMFAQLCLSYIKTAWGQMAVGMSAFNAMVSYNVKNAITGTYPSLVIDGTLLKMASGSLTGVSNGVVSASAGRHVVFGWDDNSGDGNADATDIGLPFIYNKAKNEVRFSHLTCVRSGLAVTALVPASWIGDTVYSYMAFKKVNHVTTSDSQYLGTCVILT